MKAVFTLYGLFLTSFVIFSYLFVDPNLAYFRILFTGFAFENRLVVSIFYLIFILVFFAFYHLIYKNLDKKNLPRLIFLSALILIFAYPAMLSYDIFNYIFTSKVLFFYHENPYIVMPIEFVGDPLLMFTHAANKVALYGPLWILSTGVPYLLGVGNSIATLLNFKIFSAIFYLGICYLLLKSTKDAKKTAIFALSPLVLIEILVSGHNDGVMMFFALLSILLLKKDRWILATIFIILSILIKYATIFLLPVFIYYFFCKFKDKKLDWDFIFKLSFISMFAIFLLSALRGEIYPWYGIWFLTFLPFITKDKLLSGVAILLSFSLLLRYVPYMVLGTYFGLSPIIRELVTFLPLGAFIIFYKFHPKKTKH